MCFNIYFSQGHPVTQNGATPKLFLKYAIVERFFSVRDEDAKEKFECYFILRLTFSFIFTAICFWTVSHNLLQNWRDNIALVRITSWNQANFKTYLSFSIRQILHKAKWP